MLVDHIGNRVGKLQNELILCTTSESSEAVTLVEVPYFDLVGHDTADVILLRCLDEPCSGAL